MDAHEEIHPTVYLPATQDPDLGTVTFYTRTGQEPESLAKPLREVVAAFDSNLPVFGMKTLAAQVEDTEFDDRLLTALPEVTRVDRPGRHIVVTGTGELVNAVILALAAAGVTARDVQLDSSNLEEAFVKLTGKHASTGTHASTEGALA